MSYNNILALAAVKITVTNQFGSKEDLVALFMQSADSSLRVEYGGRDQMSRSWNLMRPDEEWRVMSSVVNIASSCEGGSLRWKGNSKTKAETLIAACRKAIENAPHVQNLNSIGEGQIWQSRLELPVSIKNLAGYKKDEYDKLVASGIPHKEKYGDTMVFEFSSDAAGLSEYIKFAHLGGTYCWGTNGDWDFDQSKFDRWAEPLRAPVFIKPKLEHGAIVELEHGISYTLEGEKFNKFKIVAVDGSRVDAYGVKDDGGTTNCSYVLKGFTRHLKPTENGVAQNTKESTLFEKSEGQPSLFWDEALKPILSWYNY